MKLPDISISASTYLGLALGIMILPLDLMIFAILAATIHECCHLLALLCCQIPVSNICISLLGAKITTGSMTALQEIICAAAGPMGSLSLLLLSKHLPILALLGLCQGVFNLLPIYPLDGGRICRSIFVLAKTGLWGYNRHNSYEWGNRP